MKRIPLTKGKEALVSDQDYAFLCRWKWMYRTGREHYGGYAARRATKADRVNRYWIHMHREVARRVGHSIDARIDHENRNPCDNQRHNLRPATQTQNNANQSLQRSNTSGYRGVSRARKRWRAYISVDGATYRLGHFDTAEDAARAYDRAAKKHFGRFAFLNFPRCS